MSVIASPSTHEGYICPECGEEFIIRKALAEWANQSGKAIYCPKGHSLTIKNREAK